MGGARSRALCCALFVALALAALGGCRFPDDPEGSFDRVEGGILRVGLIEAPPWASTAQGRPEGVEVDLVREFAARHDAEVSFTTGTEAELVEALTGFQLDVVIGGLTTQTPYRNEVAVTRPYLDTEFEIGVPPGLGLPDELGGTRIWVERGSEAAARLKQEEEDAIPVFYDELREIDGPALLESWELSAIGFDSTEYILADDEHALAVPMGENALMTELEYFLLENEVAAERLLAERAEREAPVPRALNRAGESE